MEEFLTEYPQQTEYGGTDTGTTPQTEGGTTPPNTGSSGGLVSIFRPGISGGAGSGGLAGLFAPGSSLLSRMLGMTDPKPKVAEKPKIEETQTPTPAPAPVAPGTNNAKIKPWMWYVGGGVLGMVVLAAILYFTNRKS